jgi:ribulose-5-phosphate 4-epimerase/fuculose-1-phosphate aldolase
MTDSASTAIRELVVANRILANEGVVDAFGHISVRHPDNTGRYLLACSRSPGLVTAEDIVAFDLDSNRLDDTDRAIYAERFIHGCIYKARPDVMSVCHSHAHAVVPFTVTNTPIEPIWVMSSGSGAGVPNWDIRDEFPNDGTMLVVNDATGRSLAKTLGNGRVCLLRGHGAVIATGNLKATADGIDRADVQRADADPGAHAVTGPWRCRGEASEPCRDRSHEQDSARPARRRPRMGILAGACRFSAEGRLELGSCPSVGRST